MGSIDHLEGTGHGLEVDVRTDFKKSERRVWNGLI